MDKTFPVFLDTESVASYLQISVSSLEKWRVHGRGPRYRKHGRRVVYLRADLDAWSDAQARISTAEAA